MSIYLKNVCKQTAFWDMRIYMRFQDIIAALEAVRAEIQQKYQPNVSGANIEKNITLKALQASQIQEVKLFLTVNSRSLRGCLPPQKC